ncbi:MAG: hypothetical protein QXU18_13840 [Thermoplasmatales archaeon]
MLSKRSGIIISVIVVIIFSVVAVGTIERSSTSLTTSLTSAQSDVQLYSPSNGTTFLLEAPNDTIHLNLSINSTSSSLYIFDISPASPPSVHGIQLYSLPDLTYLNKTLYPMNYEVVNVNPDTNTTFTITLYVNSSVFQQMKVSNPIKEEIYPYLVEILVESSNGASVVAFTIVRV